MLKLCLVLDIVQTALATLPLPIPFVGYLDQQERIAIGSSFLNTKQAVWKVTLNKHSSTNSYNYI